MSLRLSGKLEENLHKAVMQSFPDEAALRMWVRFKMDLNLNVIKTSASLPAIVVDVFDYVESGDKWEAFLQAGIDSEDCPVFSKECRAALKVLRQQTAPAADDGKAGAKPLIWDTAPFVDRESFWIDLDELRTSPRKRVLALDGPPKSGKSYCGELIDHLRRHWQKVTFAQIDLKNERAPDIKPAELCRRILFKLRIREAKEPDPLPNQTPQRWALDLAPWVGTHIKQIGGEVWVVLDGFNDPAVPEETHVLIAALAEEAGDQNDFRLILLDYDRAFGERTERATRRTRIEYLTASDLRLFLNLLDQDYKASTKPEWQAAQMFVELYDQHMPGSATQIDALTELLPPIVRSLLS